MAMYGNLLTEEDARYKHEHAARKMANIDKLPPDIRAVIHEYGWGCVQTLMSLGVKDARRLRHVINMVRYNHGGERR